MVDFEFQWGLIVFLLYACDKKRTFLQQFKYHQFVALYYSLSFFDSLIILSTILLVLIDLMVFFTAGYLVGFDLPSFRQILLWFCTFYFLKLEYSIYNYPYSEIYSSFDDWSRAMVKYLNDRNYPNTVDFIDAFQQLKQEQKSVVNFLKTHRIFADNRKQGEISIYASEPVIMYLQAWSQLYEKYDCQWGTLFKIQHPPPNAQSWLIDHVQPNTPIYRMLINAPSPLLDSALTQ